MSSTAKKNQICCWLSDEIYEKVKLLVRERGSDDIREKDKPFASFSDYIYSLILADLNKRDRKGSVAKDRQEFLRYLSYDDYHTNTETRRIKGILYEIINEYDRIKRLDDSRLTPDDREMKRFIEGKSGDKSHDVPLSVRYND